MLRLFVSGLFVTGVLQTKVLLKAVLKVPPVTFLHWQSFPLN